MERFEIPQTESIDTLPADLRKEIDSLNLLSKYAEINNFPKEISENKWVCCCGRVNANNGNCVRCGRSKNYQFEKLTMDNLKQLAENTRQLEDAERKKREEEEKQRQLMLEEKQKEKAERKKQCQEKIKKILKRGAIVVASIIAIIVVISGGMYILNEKKYQQAKDLYENEEYYNAYKLFSDMKYYRDSKDIISQIEQNKFIFSEGYALSYGVFAVKIDGKWGFVNKTGLWLIEPMFKEVDFTNSRFPLVKIEDINEVKDIFYEDTYYERNLPQKWYELWITKDGDFYSYQGKIELSQHSYSIKY